MRGMWCIWCVVCNEFSVPDIDVLSKAMLLAIKHDQASCDPALLELFVHQLCLVGGDHLWAGHAVLYGEKDPFKMIVHG